MNLTFAANLTKMIDAGLGREAAPPETFVAVSRTTEYTDLGPVAIASFETNAAAPLRALSVAMEPIQAGTGDPSPENVRPITGRNTVTVMRAGKNLFTRTGEYEGFYLTSNGNVAAVTNWIVSDFIHVAPGVEYTFNPNSVEGSSAKACFYDKDKQFLGTYVNSGLRTFTTPDNCAFMRFSYRKTASNIQLEVGDTATAYEPYTPIQSVTIDLGDTVYGGTLDVVRGVLTVDVALMDMGALNWGKSSSGIGRFYGGLPPAEFAYKISPDTYMLSSVYKFDGKSSSGGTYYGNDGTFRYCYSPSIATREIYVHDETKESMTAAEFKTSVTGQQLVYELDTPQIIQLSAEQITTLIGQNNVWSDGGDVSLTYGTTRFTEGY